MGKFSLSILFIVLALISCAKKAERGNLSGPASYFEYAKNLYDRGKYEKAKEAFEGFLFRYPTSIYADDAQFFLAECHLLTGDYDGAISEFRFFLRSFPGSEYRRRAYLDLARAYLMKSKDPELDQSDTQKAIEILRDFLSRYQSGEETDEARDLLKRAKERLAAKTLRAAKLYEVLGKYGSARIYLDYLFANYPGTKSAQEGKLLLARVEYLEGERDSAIALLDSIIADPDISPDIAERASSMRKKILKGNR
ncbi:MAG TPA: outer membrane protein assembly factor BamD [candidate division WOR-3 bacterium]|uniref:Outer membrane protein assembly factor BamD n=1 Tax=candidate division WOR-3 bacterium TaxID=2052148 RepID=A0A7C0XC35_UNCW3|nr:outer membrane protein assembly factor BamD [candidate division WOR-3 bacterium]